MERVVLKSNAHDRRTGRDYNAGEYEVVARAENRGQMDAGFAQRVIDLDIAVDADELAANVNATDDAIALAESEGLDVTSIEGTGRGEKVTVNDVRKAIAARDEEAPAGELAGSAGGPGSAPLVPGGETPPGV